MSRPDWPLDRTLERLRAHGLPYKWHATRLNEWISVCPACRVGAWTLSIHEHGRGGAIDLRCAAGCDPADVAVVLERDPAEDRIEAAELRAAECLQLAEDARGVAVRALELAAARVEPIDLAVAA